MKTATETTTGAAKPYSPSDFWVDLARQGTGASRVDWRFFPKTSGRLDELPETVFFDVNTLLSKVRGSLSLNLSELAQLLSVERPTIYSWLRGDVIPHDSNQEKIVALYKVAEQWNQLSTLPAGDFLRKPHGTSKLSLFELLKKRPANSTLLASTMQQVADAVHKKAAARIPSVDEVARKHGRRATGRPGRDEVDLVTGKRITDE